MEGQDDNLTELWHRSLSILANCRSIKEVTQHPEIPLPIKAAMMRDAHGIYGMHFKLLERRGKEAFILSDSYPVTNNGVFDNGLSLPLYHIFPISPDHLILLFANGVQGAPQSVRGFDEAFFKAPTQQQDGSLRIRKEKVYEDTVRYFNQLSLQHATEGVIIQNTGQIYPKERIKAL